MSKNSKSQRRPIITDITIKAPTRRPWDVGDWRSALSAADRGRTKQLYDLYEDMLLDPVLSNAIDKRRDAVTNADLTFLSREGEEVDEVIDLMETEGFETLLSQIIMGRLLGRSATELTLEEDGLRAAVIPAQHIDLEHRAILPDPTSDEGAIPYDGLGSLVVLGEARHYGVILRAIPYAVYKRGGYGDWAQWVELFGMPQRIGKYSTFDPQTRVQLQEALERMGSAPYLIVPKEADIEVKETKATSGISFDQFRQACNEEILIGILGQTLTTTAGERGARSLGEVHREVEAAKYKSDMRYVRRTLNKALTPLLEARGIATKGGSFVVPEDPEPVTVDELATLSHIIAIPADYIRDKYGIPTPSEGDELAGTPQIPKTPEPSQEPEEPEETEETPEKPEPPEEEEKKEKKSLGSRLSRFFGSAPHPVTEGEGLTGRLRRWTDSIRGRITLSDDYSIDLRELLEEAVRRVYGGESDLALRLLFSASDLPLQEAVAEGLRSPSFGERNPDFDTQFRYNTAVFAAFKGHAEWESMRRELTDEEGRLRSFAAFRRAVRPIIGRYNDQWLRTEYNTVVRSARSAAKWQDALRSREALPNLEYLLSGAVDKREEHREWVGTVLPILHPWWDTHLPPSEWNCKCSFRPTDKPVTGVPDEGDHPVEPTFAQNPGRTASPLKLSEHPYLRGKGDPSCPLCRLEGLIGTTLSSSGTDHLCKRHALALPTKEIAKIMERYSSFDFKRKIYKGGGILELPTKRKYQYPHEQAKNESVLVELTKYHDRHLRALPVKLEQNVKNPDALSLDDGWLVDIKVPAARLSVSSVRRSIVGAAIQGAKEVIIDARKDFSYESALRGMIDALRDGKIEVERITFVLSGHEVKTYRAESIRKLHCIKKHDGHRK